MALSSKSMRSTVIVLIVAATALTMSGLCLGQAAPPAQSAGSRQRITVMTYNIHYGIGVDFAYNLDRIADLARDQGADIIGLCEVEQKTQRGFYDDQAKLIADRLGFHYAYGPIFARSAGFFCNALVSRFPIISHQTHPLPNPINAQHRAALEAQVDVDGTIVTVFVTHLEVADSGSRVAQARALAGMASRAPAPRIIMGDFNATPTHALETALMLREHNDTCPLHRVLVDSAWLAGQGRFERDYLRGGYTVGVFDRNSRIDYIFASHDIGVVSDVGAARVPHSLASDHLPYVVALELPRKQAEQDVPAAAALAPLPAPASQDGRAPMVAVMHSPDVALWYEDMGWYYEDDLDMIMETLSGLGIPGLECVLVPADDLEGLASAASQRPTLLVLSNARRMSVRQMQAVRDFVAAGGRVIATYQTSLKTETEAIAGEYGFGLADLFGAQMAGWTGVSPMHDAIAPVGASRGEPGAVVDAIWKGVKAPVSLPVPEGMVVKAWPGCMVLGQWSHRDGTPSRPLPVNAAMMLNGSVLYVGADLLCWDVLQEEPAKMLVANMVRFMLGIDF